jgi:hypothetical protein
MRITNRFVAFAIHLGISLVMFLILAAIIKFLWYPGVLFDTEGGWQGIKLIAAVDLVIGPVLTLMVYNVAKKELKRDLAIIGVLQLACIMGGMWTVANSRPLAVAYTSGTFIVITGHRFQEHRIDLDKIPLLQGRKPAWVRVELPENTPKRVALMLEYLPQGGVEMDTQRYRPYAEALPWIARQGLGLEEARAGGWQIPASLNSQPVRVHDLQTRYGSYKVAVDTRDGNLLQVLKKAPQP